jgi:acetyltransferase-like isoleucine patch superfamily enzyme
MVRGGIPPNVTIGAHTYGYYSDTFLWRRTFLQWGESDQIVVGKFCSFGPGVKILGGGEHRKDLVSTFPFRARLSGESHGFSDATSKGPTIIGNDVWFGLDAVVLSGVRIGDGAVIGARSVVSSDVSPYSVVAGNPARVVKFRFTDSQISKMIKIAWWNWDDETIISRLADFYADVDSFIMKYHRE